MNRSTPMSDPEYAAIRRSEERSRLAIRIAQLGTWYYDPGTNIVELDERMREIWGEYEDAVVLPLSRMMQRIHPSDRPRVANAISAALDPKSSGTYEIDYRIVWDDGTERWISTNGQAIFAGEGELRQAVEFLGTVLDITDRQRAKTALEESEARFRTFAENSKDVIWITDARENRLIYVSPSYEQVWGRSAREIYTDLSHFVEFIHRDDRQRIQAGWEQRIQGELSQEYRVIRPDGSIVWIRDRGFPIHDAQGELLYLGGIAEDITERKQTELMLVEQKKLLELIASGHPLNECLKAVCASVSHLNPRTRACILVPDAQRKRFQYSIAPDFPPSFGQGLQDAPINNVCLDTCAQAVFGGQPIICADIANDEEWSQEWRNLYMAHGVLACYSQPVVDTNNVPVSSLMLCFDEARMPSDWEYQLADFGTQITSIIFERDRSMLALHESEHRYRMLFESIDEGFCLCEMLFDENGKPTDYRFLEVNQVFEMMTGLKEVVGKTARELVPNLEESWFEIYGRVVLTGEPVRFEEQSVAMNRWFDVNAFRVGDPHSRKFAILFANISDRKQTEKALLESEERFRNMADNAPVMVWVTDPTGYCTYLSQSWYEFTGQTEEIGLGFGWTNAVHPEDRESARNIFLGATDRHEAFSLEYRLRRKDGEYRWAIDAASPWFGVDGEFKGYIGSVIDISDRKRAEQEREQLLLLEQAAREEAERANRVKDEFLAIVSHELRSPLSPILGWSKLLQTRTLNQAKTDQALSIITRNATLQAQLIEDLLDISKILRGKLSLNFSLVDLASTILAAMETVRLAAEAKSIEIHTILQPDLELALGDPSRLQQVIWNLLSNAIKFTPPGGRVEVKLSSVADEQPQITNEKFAQIIVSDTGKGIRPDFLPHVFEHFCQEDAATTRKFGGLGLGLAIVRHLVELHGGTVQAHSLGEGKGATFTVKLPLTVASPQIDRDTGVSEPALDLTGITVLVVDDDADTREFVVFLIEEYGANAIAVDSATEALIALKDSQPDVLLSDIAMPEVDGYMLVRQIRTLPPDRGGQIPAIALTAYAGEIDYQQAMLAGFQRHIPKPVDPDNLVETIADLVRHK
ncbi:MAG: PAS domain S-box protein [Nostoc sp. ChiSLP01]|nr:PAS domain S-box protein [Nostoc sp. CmiSLP01]MDZ8288300.1 PAS domain S-box protein [Nostoc sp. ChiSLP01]